MVKKIIIYPVITIITIFASLFFYIYNDPFFILGKTCPSSFMWMEITLAKEQSNENYAIVKGLTTVVEPFDFNTFTGNTPDKIVKKEDFLISYATPLSPVLYLKNKDDIYHLNIKPSLEFEESFSTPSNCVEKEYAKTKLLVTDDAGTILLEKQLRQDASFNVPLLPDQKSDGNYHITLSNGIIFKESISKTLKVVWLSDKEFEDLKEQELSQ